MPKVVICESEGNPANPIRIVFFSDADIIVDILEVSKLTPRIVKLITNRVTN
jgi:hypothetical protein